MKPVLTAAEVAAVDAAALKTVGLDVLIDRAGHAVAQRVLAQLGGAYGRRVVVVAGKGHNGDDGRVAATVLSRRGVSVRTVALEEGVSSLPPCDLVVDAAFGTGFHGTYRAPEVPAHAFVLAVDIPSGLNPDTGVACEGAVVADATISFAALKPGLVLGDGPAYSGDVTIDQIGLELGTPELYLVEEADVTTAVTPRPRSAHKWDAAVFVAAGSRLMTGAASLASLGALRSGSGMVRLGVPGEPTSPRPIEVVSIALEESGWAPAVLAELERCKALVLGPGLGTSPATAEAVHALIEASPVPIVLDADALNTLGSITRPIGRAGDVPTMVLTPHDGEFARLYGAPPGPDRIEAARGLAQRSGQVVLLKGATTVVAQPSGEALLVNSGSARLSTAGTGDVLSGIIGAFLARGLSPLLAGAIGAFVHGRAATRGLSQGLVASDLPLLVAAELGHLVDGA